MPVDFGSKAPI